MADTEIILYALKDEVRVDPESDIIFVRGDYVMNYTWRRVSEGRPDNVQMVTRFRVTDLPSLPEVVAKDIVRHSDYMISIEDAVSIAERVALKIQLSVDEDGQVQPYSRSDIWLASIPPIDLEPLDPWEEELLNSGSCTVNQEASAPSD